MRRKFVTSFLALVGVSLAQTKIADSQIRSKVTSTSIPKDVLLSPSGPTLLLSDTPSGLQLYRNGLLQTPGSTMDFTISGNVITLLPVGVWTSVDTVRAIYYPIVEG